jgi:uncharacterized protein (DUF362 family)
MNDMDKPGLSASPFLQQPECPRVFVAAGDDPYDNARRVLSRIDISASRGKKVLLKPNAGRIAAPGDGIATDPRVVAAAADAFQEAGAEVAVGDSPITGTRALEALKATGMTAMAAEHGCELLDLDARPSIEVGVPEGVAITSLKVCSEVLEYDLVVSIPVMKTHMHTGVTLAVKNMKGCLWRRSKVDLHMLPRIEGIEGRSLEAAIADMSSVLRPHLSLIDGTVGMEGLGPSAGKPRELGVVVAGADAFAADAVACALMGVDARNIAHLRMGAERGYGVIDLERIDAAPDNWQDSGCVFEAPPDSLSVEFPNVNVLDNQSCSACQSTLLLFLQRHGEELSEYLPEGDIMDMAIGKGHESLPAGTVCIGNCTEGHRMVGTFVSGCPPVASEILKTITGKEPGGAE